MELNITMTGEFVPSWNGNDQLPKENQIKAEYKRITGEMANKLMIMRSGTDEGYIDYNFIFKKCEVKIKNLKNNGKKVESADDILSMPGAQGLVTEVALHIFSESQVNKDEEKKS